MENATKKSFFKRPVVQSIIVLVVIFAALFGFLYVVATRNSVSTEDAYLDAPMVNIAPTAPGVLNAIYVKEGDSINANIPVALVGSETLYSKDAGIVTTAPKALGSFYAPGSPVVVVIAASEMRVVASLEETKGLKNVREGQPVEFTVDAFPGKTYIGTVDSIAPNSSETGVVFSISDKRPIKHFNVYVRYDVSKYGELKSGMSAKIRINTK